MSLVFNRLRHIHEMQTLNLPPAVVFHLIPLKLGTGLRWDSAHLAMGKFLVWPRLNSDDVIKKLKKSPKMAIFGLDNLCAVTKTFGDLIGGQQT